MVLAARLAIRIPRYDLEGEAPAPLMNEHRLCQTTLQIYQLSRPKNVQTPKKKWPYILHIYLPQVRRPGFQFGGGLLCFLRWTYSWNRIDPTSCLLLCQM